MENSIDLKFEEWYCIVYKIKVLRYNWFEDELLKYMKNKY